MSNSSRSWLNIYFTFSIHACTLCLRSWILFAIITLRSFLGRLPIWSSFISSCGYLACSFFCNIFLSCLVLSDLLCLWSHFCRLHGYRGTTSSTCFWCLPLVSKIGPGTCVGFLCWGLVPVPCWVELSLVPRMGKTMSGGVFWAACEFRVTSGSLSADGLLSSRLFGVRCPVLEPAGIWV